MKRQMPRPKLRRAAECLIGLAIAMSPISMLHAAPLDEVTLHQQSGVVLATIKLTTPVHFLRYVPTGKSRVLEIYYERTPGSDTTDPWADLEVRRQPATVLTPAFVVTTRDQSFQPKLVVEFSSEVEYSVTPGGDGRSFVIAIKPDTGEQASAALPLPLLPSVLPPVAEAAPGAAGEAVATDAAATDFNQQAYAAMLAGRDALSAKDFPAAIEAFNKVLSLPPNQYSQDAQEWVGVARERAGQVEKAKVEYELYLKLYTAGPGVQWVKRRLAGLALPAPAVQKAVAKKPVERSFVQGSLSSHYYYGRSSLGTSYFLNNAWQTDTTTLVDQSSLISNLDASGRYINETYDNRVVFRDQVTQNFLSNKANTNRINAAYVELKNRVDNYSGRFGRQTSGGGGVMDRFDGVSAGYGVPQELRVNGVAGRLVNFTTSAQPVFFGASIDKGPLSVYLVNQTIEGVLDRRAVGAELRHFEDNLSTYTMVDYDIQYRALNAISTTMTFGLEATGTVFNLMADFRKNINTRNALIGAQTGSIKDLLAVMSESQLQELARQRTATLSYSQVGVTQKVHQNWQVGVDMRLAKASGLSASGSSGSVQGYIDAYPSTGWEKNIIAQLIGSNLYSKADITTFGASYVTSGYVKYGQTTYVYNRTALNPQLSLDTSWNLMRQIDNYGGGTVRNTPMVRATYHVRQELSLDGDAGVEMTTNTGATQTNKNTRMFFSLGFRWDM